MSKDLVIRHLQKNYPCPVGWKYRKPLNRWENKKLRAIAVITDTSYFLQPGITGWVLDTISVMVTWSNGNISDFVINV